MSSSNKQIVQTETFKKYQHEKLQFGDSYYEVAICGYGNKLSEVQMLYQVIPRTPSASDYDVNSKMSFYDVIDKPIHVKQALATSKVIEISLNKELSSPSSLSAENENSKK
jgi:hypothetical protein